MQEVVDVNLVFENVADTTSFGSGEAALSRPTTPAEGENPPGTVVISNMTVVPELDSFIGEVHEMKKESEKNAHDQITSNDGFETKQEVYSQEASVSTFYSGPTTHGLDAQDRKVERFVSEML